MARSGFLLPNTASRTLRGDPVEVLNVVGLGRKWEKFSHLHGPYGQTRWRKPVLRIMRLIRFFKIAQHFSLRQYYPAARRRLAAARRAAAAGPAAHRIAARLLIDLTGSLSPLKLMELLEY